MTRITESPTGQTVKPVGLSMVRVSTTKAIVAAGDYAAQDVISNSTSAGTAWTFSDVVKYDGGSGTIVKAIVLCQTTNQAHGVTLYLFNATPTGALNDNLANTNPLYADASKYIGKIEFPAFGDLGDASAASDSWVVPGVGGCPLPFICAVGANDIYGVLVARDAFTNEVAGHSYIIILQIAQD